MLELIDQNLDIASGLIAFFILVLVAGAIAIKANQEGTTISEYIMEVVAPSAMILVSLTIIFLAIAFVVRYLLTHFFHLGVM